MFRRFAILMVLLGLCQGCDKRAEVTNPKGSFWTTYKLPDWRKYRAQNVISPAGPAGNYAPTNPARVTFRDLKYESDPKLALRLLGEVGRRIAYIDRHRDRWQYYESEAEAADSIDLYTHPYALGSQYGLCGTERYAIAFNEDGTIQSVAVTERYGVEGPVLQKDAFDWDYYYKTMCSSVPASHAPSYFPATDSLIADDAVEVLIVAFDLASSPGTLPFPLTCRTWRNQSCVQGTRAYLGNLRLEDIDEFSAINCPLVSRLENSFCFTVITDAHEVGPFPKYVTVKGSTYMNNYRIDSIEVVEGYTVT
jgi:hypothetical protein